TNCLRSNTTGMNNMASGVSALQSNMSGSQNTATGVSALSKNVIGNFNTANGFNALVSNTSGLNNIALGNNAGANLTTGNNNIDSGNPGVAAEGNTIRIGIQPKQTATFVAGIRGVATANPNAVPVVIDSEGQLGTVSSSARFKDGIAAMSEASNAVLALRPV